MKQTQLIKGVLEGCVLAITAQGEIYGYELIQALHQNGFTTIVGGTLYPLLIKLEKNGDLQSIVKPSADGPDRKYYVITTQGIRTLHTFNQQWFQLKNHVDKILKKADDNL
ncbi:PadR family transcriptional regulator [Pediococcus cellicola]|uniref:Transcription regulator n=1 Tax=Pediococcus cellicola TaxID=319652 RepID=A0A0R2IQB5_9LACO|nr:PadR family transcriptional regulator [Pediococcus cellicola]KRN66926.1 transcription regulator [Pediococcus cellicola]GEL16097.1 PadR family transcriptional regulator [Pediococcus cellicola]